MRLGLMYVTYVRLVELKLFFYLSFYFSLTIFFSFSFSYDSRLLHSANSGLFDTLKHINWLISFSLLHC